MASTSNTLPIRTSTQVSQSILDTVSNGVVQAQVLQGITNPVLPDVSPASLVGLLAKGIGNEVGTANSSTQAALNQQMPDSAQGTSLDRWLNIYDIPRRNASPAVGSVIGATSPLSATVFIPAGTQLTSPAGIRYATLVSGTYGNGSAIQITAVDVGANTDQIAGTVLTWTSAPAFFNPQAIVSALDPLTDGTDQETDGIARQRLSNFFANPPVSGNPTQIIELAQAASTDVQTGYISPAARGPASLDVVVVGYASSTNSSRTLNSTILTNVVAPYVQGNVYGGADVFVTNTVNYPINLSIKLSLPFPPTSQPPGPGGGWLDPAPWQVSAAKPMIRVVDGYAISGDDPLVPQNNANQFWIDFPVGAPLQGTQYSISYLSPIDLVLYSGQTNGVYIHGPTFSSLSGHTSLYYITLNTPFFANSVAGSTILPGSCVFPTADNTATYVAALLNYFASMGPGERTNNLFLLPRATRQPLESLSGNYILNERAVKPIINSGSEVFDGLIYFKGIYSNDNQHPISNGSGVTDTTPFAVYTGLVGNTAYSLSAPPTAYVANGNNALGPSYIFVPGNISFYQM